MDDPTLGLFADRLNSMPKYVASRTLRALAWNATLLEGDLAESVTALKERSWDLGRLRLRGAAHSLTAQGLVDEFRFWVSPYLWTTGPRIFDGVGPIPLELIGSTTFASGVVRLAYRSAPGRADGASPSSRPRDREDPASSKRWRQAWEFGSTAWKSRRICWHCCRAATLDDDGGIGAQADERM